MPVPIGESQITPAVLGKVAPDVVSPPGTQALQQKAVRASQTKNLLDGILQAVAQKAGGNFDSRVKNIQTTAQKIAQKRLEGRDYQLSDVNDMAGFRITLPSTKQFTGVKNAIASIAKAGIFTVEKQEKVKQGTYKGYHIDIQMKDGEKAEIQLHTPQTALEAVANHTLRAEHGEHPTNDTVTTLRDKQAQIAARTPNTKALAITRALQNISSGQGGKIAPLQSAQLLSA